MNIVAISNVFLVDLQVKIRYEVIRLTYILAVHHELKLNKSEH